VWWPAICCLTLGCSHFLNSTDDEADLSQFDCVYSPAKRRGPVPGRSAMMALSGGKEGAKKSGPERSSPGGASPVESASPALGHTPAASAALQQLQQQQQILLQHTLDSARLSALGLSSSSYDAADAARARNPDTTDSGNEPPLSQRTRLDPAAVPGQSRLGAVPWTVMQHTKLLNVQDPVGDRCRSYYNLSINELYKIPPTPTEEEYFYQVLLPLQPASLSSLGDSSLAAAALTGTARGQLYEQRVALVRSRIPGSQLSALAAARFAELALGAITQHELSLALELANAVVHCLREAVVVKDLESISLPVPMIHQIAKAYFLLGVFRAYRGDMGRYFKYRRVCLTYLSSIEVSCVGPLSLLSLLRFEVSLSHFDCSGR
jgi:hypothetical protein